MAKIIGIAGKKQSGKNTSANFFHGKVLQEIGAIQDFKLLDRGQLVVKTSKSNGEIGWGEFDVTRKDSEFVEYAEENMWPYVKLYSFADILKWIGTELFDIPYECLYGTDEQKNQQQEHLLWENMPGIISPIGWSILEGRLNTDIMSYPEEFGLTIKDGCMTAREFVQFLGTNIMRKISKNIWVNFLMKQIKKEKSELSIVADVRFPNEVDAILENGGQVIKLNRNSGGDAHESETALDPSNFDQSKFTTIINNHGSVSDLSDALERVYQLL